MTVSIDLSNEDSELMREYAEHHGMTLSEALRRSLLEKIEDEYDLRLYEKAKKEFEKNPVTYTLDEVEKELGL